MFEFLTLSKKPQVKQTKTSGKKVLGGKKYICRITEKKSVVVFYSI